MGENFAGSGVVDGKGLTGGRSDKAAIDQHAVIGCDEIGGAPADAWINGKSRHSFDLGCIRTPMPQALLTSRPAGSHRVSRLGEAPEFAPKNTSTGACGLASRAE